MKAQTLCVQLEQLLTLGVSPHRAGVYDLDLSKIPEGSFSFISRSLLDVETKDSTYAEIALNNPQILAYTFAYTRKDGDIKFLQYTRPPTDDGEQRLVDLKSIGFGGHVDLGDVTVKLGEKLNTLFDVKQTLAKSVIRELAEELVIPLSWLEREYFRLKTSRLVCYDKLISDPRKSSTNPNAIEVGETHRAVVWGLDLTNIENSISHTSEIGKVKWVGVDELKDELRTHETWSQLLITDFIGSVEGF
jgi:predicted NUDIX family phosphoesterase